jgi:purine-binding chemotaxis protein CheW
LIKGISDFSRELEDLSPNLSPTRREALISPPSLVGKGAGGLGLRLAFPHNVKSQRVEVVSIFGD